MLSIVSNDGVQTYCMQIISSSHKSNWYPYNIQTTVYAMSLCGREASTKAVAASFVTEGYVRLKKEDGSLQRIIRGESGYRMKRIRLSDGYYQVVVYHANAYANKQIIRQADFPYFLKQFTVPVHPDWYDFFWKKLRNEDEIQKLDGYGLDEDYFFAGHIDNAVLGTIIEDNWSYLKPLLN